MGTPVDSGRTYSTLEGAYFAMTSQVHILLAITAVTSSFLAGMIVMQDKFEHQTAFWPNASRMFDTENNRNHYGQKNSGRSAKTSQKHTENTSLFHDHLSCLDKHSSGANPSLFDVNKTKTYTTPWLIQQIMVRGGGCPGCMTLTQIPILPSG